MERFVQNLKVRHIAVFLISLSMLCMVVLSLLVHFHPVSTFDLHFTREIQEGRGFALLPAMQFVSFFGAPLVASGTVLLTALAFYLLERRREAFFVLGAFFADGLNALLKLFHLFERDKVGEKLIQFGDCSLWSFNLNLSLINGARTTQYHSPFNRVF
jgi:hypothetical protein